jgi:hypothetical protein
MSVGLRSGRFWRLNRVQRAHFKACLKLAERVGAVFSGVVVAQLRTAIKILMPIGEKAFEVGLERAGDMVKRFKRSGVFKWAPQVRLWLRDEAYISYLGFMELNNLVYFRGASL